MRKSHRKIGDEGEDLAVAYLMEKGWEILDRNYFFEKAEIDIIAADDAFIVFLEVKLRSGIYFGRPEEHVTPAKEKNVKKAAEAWLYEQNRETAMVRFDIIAIVHEKENKPEITHFEDAFR